MKKYAFVPALAVLGMFSIPLAALDSVLYEQTFDSTAAASDFDTPLATTVPDTAAPAFSVEFGFDYSTLTLPSQAGALAGSTVPEAPNTPSGAAATRGLAIQVNTDSGSQAQETVSVYLAQQFEGDIELQVDVYYFWDGAGGSTEDPIVGIHHSGDEPVGVLRSAAPFQLDTDGYFFKTYGDVDVSGPDYFFFVGGEAPLDFAEQPGTTWGDGQSPNVPGRDALAAGDQSFADLLTSADVGTPAIEGAFVYNWNTVRIRRSSGVVRLYLNDVEIARVNDSTWSEGKVLLGMEDSFPGVNTGNYVLFDNLIVLDAVDPTEAEGWDRYE